TLVPLPSLSRAITSGSSLPTVRAYTSEGIGRKKRPPGDSPPLQESGQRFPLGKVARFTCVSLDHLREPRPQIHQIGPLSPTVLVLDTQPRIESAVHLADPIEHFQQRDATRDLDEPRENVVDQANVELVDRRSVSSEASERLAKLEVPLHGSPQGCAQISLPQPSSPLLAPAICGEAGRDAEDYAEEGGDEIGPELRP